MPIITSSLLVALFISVTVAYKFLDSSGEEINQVATSQTVEAETPEKLPKLKDPLPWPKYGYSAYAVPKDKLFASSPKADKPVPVASLAKVITVIAVLQEKPLEPGEQGPTITLSDEDVKLVNEYARKNGTYVPVQAGEKISEYQALQAILMVSSNNMADSLASWAFGSVEGYTEYANKMLKDMGIENTTVADDASGYSPNTVSTPEDMTKLGQIYMKHPVLRQIAMEKQTTIPVANIINNNNDFMNNENVFGIKVGDTDEAGKCYLAAEIRENKSGEEEISVTVVLGADSFYTAAKDAKKILKAGNKEHDSLPNAAN